MWAILGLILGILAGTLMPFQLPPVYSKYVSVSFLAGLDSVLGATRAGLERKYDFSTFVSGFTINVLLAALLTYVGDRLGVDLYLAAVVTFGMRIFGNLGYIRRDLIFNNKKAEENKGSASS
jgi:small basic protein